MNKLNDRDDIGIVMFPFVLETHLPSAFFLIFPVCSLTFVKSINMPDISNSSLRQKKFKIVSVRCLKNMF